MTDEELHKLLDEATPGKLRADVSDPEDVVLWLDNKFAGNIGQPIQRAGLVFDVDAALALEISWRWKAFPDLAAEVLRLREVERAAEHLADALQAGVNLIAGNKIGREWKEGCSLFVKDARAVLVAYRDAKEDA